MLRGPIIHKEIEKHFQQAAEDVARTTGRPCVVEKVESQGGPYFVFREKHNTGGVSPADLAGDEKL